MDRVSVIKIIEHNLWHDSQIKKGTKEQKPKTNSTNSWYANEVDKNIINIKKVYEYSLNVFQYRWIFEFSC